MIIRNTKIRSTKNSHRKRAIKAERIFKKIGNEVAYLRIESGMSQERLAQKVGLSRTSIVNIEAGRQRIRIITLAKIARVLGVTLRDLLP